MDDEYAGLRGEQCEGVGEGDVGGEGLGCGGRRYGCVGEGVVATVDIGGGLLRRWDDDVGCLLWTSVIGELREVL